MVDIPRKSQARKRRIRQAFYLLLVLVVIVVGTWYIGKLKPAAPTVERSTVVIDEVKRGPMLRNIRGLGTLVPEEIIWIPAVSTGRVERIVAKPGDIVTASTVLIELSNPELQREFVDSQMQLRGAEAEYKNAEVRLESQALDQQAAAATVQSNYSEARLNAEVREELVREGLSPELDLKVARVRRDELAVRNEIEKKRLLIFADSIKSQLAVQRARVDQLKALTDLRRSQVDSLRVRAGTAGVVQVVPVEVGQRVEPGTKLARVAEPGKLRAELRINETQAKDVAIGQLATIDTRNGIVPGRVTRIDPSSQNSTVTVDVRLEGPLPQGARPDLTVDGTIELERLDNIIYVGRPAFGQEHSTITLFKLDREGREAYSVQVKLGRTSVSAIEILEGLQPGDKVILSDMSASDGVDRVRLN